MKLSDIRKVLTDRETVTDAQVKQLLDLFHEEVDPLKDNIQELTDELANSKNGASKDAKDWKDKYEKEHDAFEKYKSEQSAKETKDKKVKALKDLLSDVNLSESGKAKALKYTSLEFDLDDDGKIKDAKKLMDSIKVEWSDFIVEEDTKGTDTKGKDGAGTKGKSGLTKEQIYEKDEKGRYKLSTSERQKALSELYSE